MYDWVDRSTDGLLVPEGIICLVVGVSVLTWFIRNIFLKFTVPKVKIKINTTCMLSEEFPNPIDKS